MKINDLIDGFNAITPTEEKKEKMLSEILKAENKKTVKIFDFKRAGIAVAGLAAAVVLAVSVYNFGSIESPNNGTYVAQVKEEAEKVSDNQTIEPLQNDTAPKTEKKAEVKRPADKKGIQVATVKPTQESSREIINDVPESAPQPRASGGGSGAAYSRRSVREDVESAADENVGIATASEELTDNSGIAAASEEISENAGVSAVSVEDEENTEAEDEEEDENKEENEEK